MSSESPAQARSFRIERLDVLRGIAILLVVVSHGLPRVVEFPHSNLIGVAGVSLFFVISGFCIHLAAQKTLAKACDYPSFVREFFWRRAWRIYLPYVVALLAATYLEGRLGLVTTMDFWTHLFLIHNWSDTTFFTINPAFWSIAVEWQFYLLYPVLLLAWRRFGAERTMLGVLLFSMAARGLAAVLQDWSEPGRPSLWGSTFVLLIDWTLGVWLADRWLTGRAAPLLERAAPWAMLAVIPATLTDATLTLVFPLFSIGFAGCLSYVVRVGAGLSRLERGLLPIGLCSYSLYLWHQPLIGRLEHYAHVFGVPRGGPWTLITLLFIVLPLLVAGSWLAYQLIERPAIAVGHHVYSRRRPQREPGAG